MCFGVKHAFRAGAVFGRTFLVTSEKVCGPTCFGLVLLTIFRVSPWVTVFGPSKKIFPFSNFMSISAVVPVAGTSAAPTGAARTSERAAAGTATSRARSEARFGTR